VELSPRTLDDPAGEGPGEGTGDGDRPVRSRNPKGRLALLVLVAVVAVLGFLVWKGLSNATVYFRNADEAVAERDELGDRRFRIQGSVVDDAEETRDGVDFDITYNGVDVAIRHVGDPPELFEPGIPVVLEGTWDPGGGDFFASDRMLIKHDATYESQDDYNDRVREADEGGNDGQPAEGDAEGDSGGDAAG
jgi:cytochrome c-type biogenesis protein CcmE